MDQSSKVYIKLEDVRDEVVESLENHLSQNE